METDIDVKKSINRLLAVSRKVDSMRSDEKNSLEKSVITDLHSFIKKISTANTEERISLFDKMYIDKEFTAAKESLLEEEPFPIALAMSKKT